MKKTKLKKMTRNDSPVSKVSLKLMKIQRTNLTKPGTTIGTKFSVLQGNPNPVFDEMWFFTIDPFVKNIRVHRKAFQATILLACVSRTFIVKNISNSLTYTVASSCV